MAIPCCFVTIALWYNLKQGWWFLPQLINYSIFLCVFIWSWKLFLQYLWRIVLGFWWGLCWICRLLLVDGNFHHINPTGPWAWEIFPSSEIFFDVLKFVLWEYFICLVRVTPRHFWSYYKNVLFPWFLPQTVCHLYIGRLLIFLCVLILYPAPVLKAFIRCRKLPGGVFRVFYV